MCMCAKVKCVCVCVTRQSVYYSVLYPSLYVFVFAEGRLIMRVEHTLVFLNYKVCVCVCEYASNAYFVLAVWDTHTHTHTHTHTCTHTMCSHALTYTHTYKLDLGCTNAHKLTSYVAEISCYGAPCHRLARFGPCFAKGHSCWGNF